MTTPDKDQYQKPQLNRTYANYERLLLPFEVTVDFWRNYGVVPEEVIFCKPGMWLAGPLPEPALSEDPEDGAPLLVGVPETTETAPVSEGQTRFL